MYLLELVYFIVRSFILWVDMMGIGPNFNLLMIGEEIILSENKREGTESEDC